jgi:hypothetical protein
MMLKLDFSGSTDRREEACSQLQPRILCAPDGRRPGIETGYVVIGNVEEGNALSWTELVCKSQLIGFMMMNPRTESLLR